MGITDLGFSPAKRSLRLPNCQGLEWDGLGDIQTYQLILSPAKRSFRLHLRWDAQRNDLPWQRAPVSLRWFPTLLKHNVMQCHHTEVKTGQSSSPLNLPTDRTTVPPAGVQGGATVGHSDVSSSSQHAGAKRKYPVPEGESV